jgi:hypothetical protein
LPPIGSPPSSSPSSAGLLWTVSKRIVCLHPAASLVAIGLAAIAAGYVYSGAVVLIFARVVFAIVAPIVAAEQSTDRIGAIAAYATWSDCGLAAGAFIGIMGMELLGYSVTYAALAAATLAAVLWFTIVPAVRPQVSA